MPARTTSNRRNSLRSTGPRSAAGKAVSSRNAVRHGGYSDAITILGEDPAAFAALLREMEGALTPAGPLERRLVARLASLWWRIGRVQRAEGEGLKNCVEEARYCLGRSRLMYSDPLEEVVHKPAPDYSEPTYIGFSWGGAGDCMDRLLRHETQLERSFYRALHELERIQARRQGQSVPPPVAVDVNLSGSGD